MTVKILERSGRIAIVNRGEPAIRFLNAVADYNAEHGTALQTIALYTKPDLHARFVQRADSAYCLGDVLEADPSIPDENGNPSLRSAYLIYDRLRGALRETRADAVWVGWGFVAEDATFADLCDEMGISFIGPTGASMRALGDKIGSKQLAESCGVPVSAWSGGPAETADAAQSAARQIGYPLVIKATAGGGGRGIRVVRHPQDLVDAYHSASLEAEKAFGNGTVFLEKMVLDARHIEVQVVADLQGNIWAVGLRDCSVQRRNQKVIEEAPASILAPDSESQLLEYARAITRVSDYHNAGTVEFLYTPQDHQIYFMEMNTRLQVEHPVTELTTGLDLVGLQIRVAMGGALEGEPPPSIGHAIEVRLNAEDPYNHFAPSPGRIDLFTPAGGPGIRVDSGVETHSEIPAAFDSMIAKIIAYGGTREQAIARARRALRETAIVIRNGTTNKAFLLELLDHPTFRANKIATSWLDNLMKDDGLRPNRGQEAALIVGCIEFYAQLLHRRRREFFQTVARGRTRRLPVASTAEVELRFEGTTYSFRVGLLEPEHYRIHFATGSFDVRLVRDTPFHVRLFYDEKKFACIATPRGDNIQVEVDGACFLVEQDSGGVIRCQSPAVVLDVHTSVGRPVCADEPLVTLEAMKMEMIFLSSQSGIVKQVPIKKGDQVGAGDPLVVLEPETSKDIKSGGEPVTFRYDSMPEPETDAASHHLRQFRAFMLGFDAHHFSLKSLFERLPQTMATLGEHKNGRLELIRFFQKLFDLYFDIEFLFLRSASVSDTDINSPQQNFFTYLRLLDSGKAHPSSDFLNYLKRALAHYGVTPDSPSEELEEVLIRLCYSHHHARIKRSLLKAVHDAFAESTVFSQKSRQLRLALEWVIEGSHKHFREIHELSVDFYYRFFGEQEIDRNLRSGWGNLDSLLTSLEDADNPEIRADLLYKITHLPFPILKHLLGRFRGITPHCRQILMEILLRRINLDADLQDMQTGTEGDVIYAKAIFPRDRVQVLAMAIGGTLATLDQALSFCEAAIRQGYGRRDLLIDFYLAEEETQTEEAYAALIEAKLANFPLTPQVSRIRFAIGDDFPSPRFFHFRTGRAHYKERRIFRGVPEFLARRICLERLIGFQTTRLATPERINLFHCIAAENVSDQRLISFSEVREKPPKRQVENIFAYPALRRHLLRVLNTMRQHQDELPKMDSFYWNQVIVYVCPVLSAGREPFLSFLRRALIGYERFQLEKIRIYLLMMKPYGDVESVQVEISFPADLGIELRYVAPITPPIKPLSQRDFQLALARRRGLNHPYEVIALLTGGYFYKGEFQEYVLNETEASDGGSLVLLDDPTREVHRGGMMAGVITNFTPLFADGIRRVLLLSDGNLGLGCLAELECRTVIGAIELARELCIPLEWFPISSGAKIAMDSGTENLDWTARVLRAIIEFTQEGGEINLVVDGINVGAQSYWNAEATMMMHTKGCLIMTPRGCMVLTGKSALDYAGSVSAEDNQGIGGLEAIMGPNGQVHYPARDLLDACNILFRYYAVTYVAVGETRPRSYASDDPTDRDIRETTYAFSGTPDFTCVGDLFDENRNPGKKKPFDMRQVMRAVADQAREPLERWPLLAGGETTIVFDTTIGGICTGLIGIQSHPLERGGNVPNDGPDSWSGGTLFPLSSKKLARALNAASGNRPMVILANLSGFDGSPESLRHLQLEYGAEIGRAVVNFKGPLLFCVLSRYHGGAYVVFSNVLNPNLRSIAVKGTFASVIGGAPAAAVVFPRQVHQRTMADPRLKELHLQFQSSTGQDSKEFQRKYDERYREVTHEKQQEIAAEFDAIHTVQRAQEVGSLDEIIDAGQLRAYLVAQLAISDRDE